MKIFKKFLALLLVIALLAPNAQMRASAETFNVKNENSRNPRWIEYKNWISDGWNILKDRRYCDMVLIGTHDAGTYDLKHFSPFQIEEGLSNTMHKLHYVPGVWQIAKHYAEKITFNKSVTQEVNIYNQLMEGNRYLDLRLKRFDGDGKLRTFHGMFGDELDSIMRQIKDFIKDTDSREIVYINFNQFGSMWDMTAQDKKELGERFYKELGQYIFTPEEFSFTKTMEELAATGKRLVINSIDEVADAVHSTLKDYTIPQAQHGSQQMHWNVIPHITDQYNKQYRNTTDQAKLDQWYQMKLQYSWVTSEDLDPVLDRLKKVDLDGALKTFNANIGKSLKNYTEESRGDIFIYMRDTGSAKNENQPNVWLRDFPNEHEVSVAVARNFGKDLETRYQTTKELNEKYLADPYDVNNRTIVELAKGSRRTIGELEPEFNVTQSGEDSRIFGNGRSKAPWTILKGDLLFGQIEKIGIRTDKRLNEFTVTIGGETSSAGVKAGQYQELILDKDEYVTKIRTDEGFMNGVEGILYVKVETNKGRSIAGGTETISSMTHVVPQGWHITRVGLRAAKAIDCIGFLYQPISDINRPMIKSGLVGYNRGPSFDFIHDILYTKTTPNQITVGYAKDLIESVGMKFYNGASNQTGQIKTNKVDIMLNENEYLKEVKVYNEMKNNKNITSGIMITTNMGNVYPCGKISGPETVYRAKDGWMISGFYGQSDVTINKLGVIYEPIQ